MSNVSRPGTAATIAGTTVPQAALIGIAVTSGLEIVFDTLKTSRKYRNLTENQNVALVVDCGNESTVQYEGVAAELFGTRMEHYQAAYFEVFPDGRERQTWPNIAYFMIRPKWIRYSDFSKQTEQIIESSADSQFRQWQAAP
jgi:hypothetical protein